MDEKEFTMIKRLNDTRDRQIENLEKLAENYDQQYLKTNDSKFFNLSEETRKEINILYNEQNQRLQQERHKAKRVRQ